MTVIPLTLERTEKLPMGSIKNVVSEPIEGHEDYHMMVSRCVWPLGSTSAPLQGLTLTGDTQYSGDARSKPCVFCVLDHSHDLTLVLFIWHPHLPAV